MRNKKLRIEIKISAPVETVSPDMSFCASIHNDTLCEEALVWRVLAHINRLTKEPFRPTAEPCRGTISAQRGGPARRTKIVKLVELLSRHIPSERGTEVVIGSFRLRARTINGGKASTTGALCF